MKRSVKLTILLAIAGTFASAICSGQIEQPNMVPIKKLLIKNITIITVNGKNEIIENGSIVIEGNMIKDIGPANEIASKYRIENEIDGQGMIAMPGLINNHVHTITSLYKGTMVGFGFEKTAGEDMSLAYRATPEIMLAASRLAAAEMLLSGTTMANVATDAITFEVSSQTAEALGQAGMKAFVQTAIADILGPTDYDADSQLAEAGKLLREYHGKFDERIRVSLGPATDMTTSLKTMRHLADLAMREDLVVHMHIFPRWPTGIFSLLIRGRTPIGLLKSGKLLNNRLIAVHFLAAKKRDIKKIAKAGTSVVHCPSVWMNAAIGPKHWLPIKSLYKAGVNITLGTDSYGGWLEGSDMFTEMRNCILMNNFLYGAGSLKPADILRMATINGAKALRLENETGSLEIGKRADIILLKLDSLLSQPSSDIPAMIVYGASGRDVQTTLIDGQIVMHDRVILTLDGQKVLADAAKARDELYHLGSWDMKQGKAIPPATHWIERSPNKKLAKWGTRWVNLKQKFGK